MKDPRTFLKVSVKIFKILAWVALALQVLVGLILLIGGGPSVPIGAVEVPARLVGLLNCVAGAVYFFMLLLIANVIQVLLEVHERVRPS